jgi:hypothetical protein
VLTDGALRWDSERDCFDREATTALPPAALNRITHEPLWIDLSWIGDGVTDRATDDPRLRDAVASLAATLRGVDKDSIIGEDLARRRGALRLAYAGITVISALLIAVSVAAYGFLQQTGEAERQRDQAGQALLEAAARASMLVTRDGDPELAWSSLRSAVQTVLFKNEKRDWLPAAVHEAGLSALIENRFGPTLPLAIGTKSLSLANERGGLSNTTEVVATFSPDSSLVAASLHYDLAVWRVEDGHRVSTISLTHTIERIWFHHSGRVLFAIGRIVNSSKEKKTKMPILTRQFRL